MIDKSRLVDYDHFLQENLPFYIEKKSSLVKKSGHKSGCRRECGYKQGQSPKILFFKTSYSHLKLRK